MPVRANDQACQPEPTAVTVDAPPRIRRPWRAPLVIEASTLSAADKPYAYVDFQNTTPHIIYGPTS